MELMENERAIDTPIKQLMLTNFRIRSEFKKWGKGKIKSIMLDELSSIQLFYKSKPKLIWYGFVLLLISGLAGIYVGVELGIEDSGVVIAAIGTVLFVLFIILYIFSRRHVISFSSSSTSIDIKTRGLKYDEIKKLIDTVEGARKQLM